MYYRIVHITILLITPHYSSVLYEIREKAGPYHQGVNDYILVEKEDISGYLFYFFTGTKTHYILMLKKHDLKLGNTINKSDCLILTLGSFL